QIHTCKHLAVVCIVVFFELVQFQFFRSHHTPLGSNLCSKLYIVYTGRSGKGAYQAEENNVPSAYIGTFGPIFPGPSAQFFFWLFRYLLQTPGCITIFIITGISLPFSVVVFVSVPCTCHETLPFGR